jgi:hypothetical protein
MKFSSSRTGTGFSQNQHGCIGRSNGFNLSQDPLDSRTSADNLLEIVAPLLVFGVRLKEPGPLCAGQ